MYALFQKITLRALLFAGIACLLSFFLLKTTHIDAFVVCLAFFYMPADLATFLCSSSSQFEKGSLPVQGFPFFYLFALVQWYIIILVGILIYRHFYSKKGSHEPAP